MTSKSAIHVFTRLLPVGSLLVSLPLVSLLVSPALADSTAQTDTTAAPVKAPLHPKKHKVAKAPSPDQVAVPTKKPVAAAPAVDTSSPLTLNLTYTGEDWQNSGGKQAGNDYMWGVDASLTVDGQKLFGWQGATFYVEGFYVGGKSLDDDYVGAGEAPSALDAFGTMNTPKLYQAYYDQQIGNTNILIGKYDVQTQFGTTHPMDLFANKSQAMTMTYFTAGLVGTNFPSVYPDTSVGVRVKQTFNDQWSVKLGLLNGEADSPDATASTDVVIAPKYGALALAEVDYTPSKYTKLMVGTWADTGLLTAFQYHAAPTQTWGEIGEYVGGATRLYTIEGARGVDGFFNIGLAPGTTNLASFTAEAGVTITGLFSARPKDGVGIAVAYDQNSQDFKNLYGGNLASYESVVEFTYRAKITDWLNVQPEVDYIGNPALAYPSKSAFAYGLHFELHREFN